MWIDPCEEAERHFRACDKQEAAIRDSERAAVLREQLERMERIEAKSTSAEVKWASMLEMLRADVAQAEGGTA